MRSARNAFNCTRYRSEAGNTASPTSETTPAHRRRAVTQMAALTNPRHASIAASPTAETITSPLTAPGRAVRPESPPHRNWKSVPHRPPRPSPPPPPRGNPDGRPYKPEARIDCCLPHRRDDHRLWPQQTTQKPHAHKTCSSSRPQTLHVTVTPCPLLLLLLQRHRRDDQLASWPQQTTQKPHAQNLLDFEFEAANVTRVHVTVTPSPLQLEFSYSA